MFVKRQQVVGSDKDLDLDGSQAVRGLVGRRLQLDMTADRKQDRLSVGVDRL